VALAWGFWGKPQEISARPRFELDIYWMNLGTRWTTEIPFPARSEIFLFVTVSRWAPRGRSTLSDGYWESYPVRSGGRRMKLATHLRPMARSRTRGAMPSFFHTSLGRGLHDHRDNCTFTHYLRYSCVRAWVGLLCIISNMQTKHF
jgi:hypothetical protein